MTHEGDQCPSTAAKRHHMHAPVIQLNALIIGIAHILRRTLGGQVALSTSLSRDLWPTRADPGQFQSAILRMAVNGREAMPEGGKLVVETRNVTIAADHVALQSKLKPGDYVQLAISDTGAEMPLAVRSRVLEPYSSSKGTGRDAGVGLANVHSFIKEYGGHITIIRATGQGMTFNLYLPRAEGPRVATCS
jgi:signal transduction histidine kinase